MNNGVREYTLSEEQYDEEKDDESSMGTLLRDYKDSEIPSRKNPNRSNWLWSISLHVAAISLYGLIALLIIYYTNKRHNTVQSLIYCKSMILHFLVAALMIIQSSGERNP